MGKSFVVLLLVAGCAASAPPVVVDDSSTTLKVPLARVMECKTGGGCWLLTRTQLEKMVSDAVDAGARTCSKKVLL